MRKSLRSMNILHAAVSQITSSINGPDERQHQSQTLVPWIKIWRVHLLNSLFYSTEFFRLSTGKLRLNSFFFPQILSLAIWNAVIQASCNKHLASWRWHQVAFPLIVITVRSFTGEGGCKMSPEWRDVAADAITETKIRLFRYLYIAQAEKSYNPLEH